MTSVVHVNDAIGIRQRPLQVLPDVAVTTKSVAPESASEPGEATDTSKNSGAITAYCKPLRLSHDSRGTYHPAWARRYSLLPARRLLLLDFIHRGIPANLVASNFPRLLDNPDEERSGGSPPPGFPSACPREVQTLFPLVRTSHSGLHVGVYDPTACLGCQSCVRFG